MHKARVGDQFDVEGATINSDDMAHKRRWLVADAGLLLDRVQVTGRRCLEKISYDQYGNFAGVRAARVIRFDLELNGFVAGALETHAYLHDVTGARAANVVELERLDSDVGFPDLFSE
jgi:hypothetical protein